MSFICLLMSFIQPKSMAFIVISGHVVSREGWSTPMFNCKIFHYTSFYVLFIIFNCQLHWLLKALIFSIRLGAAGA